MAPLSCPTRVLAVAAAHLASQAHAALPNIDFDALGSVGLAGNFAGLQLWDSSYASTSQALNDSGADAASSLWLRSSSKDDSGELQYLGSTDQGGSISALCQASSDSDASGLLFLGGNFTSINGTQASNIAAYDADQHQFSSLAGGLDGPVLALACHDDSNTLFVGGSFTAPEDADSDDDSYAGSVASWSYTDQAWSSLPFSGLNGPVYSIEPAGNDDSSSSVFFAGNFTISVSNTTNTRLSSDNPAADFESLGSALSPISLNTSRVWAGPGGSGSPHELFCPEGDGESGSQWTVEGQDPPIIVVRTDQAHQVRGLRIGNTFQNRGTSQFKVISVPDSIVQTFTYLSDPTDIDSPLTTCDWECPLSDDPSVAYEDFLFQEGTNITGFQINLDDYYGDGAGLHQLTLLSSGGFAYADSSLNSNASNSCGSGVAGQSPSSSSVEGDWTATSVPSSIDGVDTSALVATVDTGASQSDSPSITFSPNIVAKTDYDVFLVTPGCADMGNCDARTSVQVSADSGTGSSDSTTVSQTNQEQQSVLVYSGELTAGATFTLRLASDPEGSGSGGEYTLVAGYIQLVAQDTSATRISDQDGRGLFEYVLSGSDGVFGDGAAAAASSSDVNVAEDSVTNATAFTQLALSFNSSSDASVRSVVFHNQVAYFGGTFEAGENVSTANVAAFGGDLGADSPAVPNGGLDGPVRALLVVGDWLYAAGSFDGTDDESVSGLGGIARWDTTKSDGSWSPLKGGDAPFFDDGFARLSSVKMDGDDVLVAVAASSSSSGGRTPIALWNTKSKEWTDDGLPFIAGTTSAVTASNTDEGSLFFAGRISSALSSSFSGATRLTTNSSGQPSLQPYGFSFSTPSSAESSSDGESSDPTLRQKRATSTFNLVQKRAPAEVTSLPTPISQTAEPQILTGAFYSEGDSDVIVLGGRFSTENGVDNIGIYDTDSKEISALADSNSIDGTVRALRVVDDTVWIGGQFTTQDGSAGLIRYELDEDQWNPIAAAMNPYDDMNVTVTSLLTTEAQASEVLVAGSFASVGSLTCLSICLYNVDDNQWSALGSGLNGFIAALDYAGDDSQFIYAAGSFELNGTPAYVARWNRDENEWSLLGDADALSGPATAVASNDQDEKRIFVAGVSSDGSEPYLMFWNGESWADAGSSALQEGTEFQHIGFVPLSHDEDDHDEDLIQNDRLLMVSGDLDFADYGRVSSALFDGMTWTPFLVSSTGSGDTGIISSFFYSASTFTLSPSYLSVGIVILISIAISLGVVFLVVIIGLLVALHQRRSDNNNNAASAAVAAGYSRDDDDETNRRPTSLLATLNAATAMMTAGKMNGHQKRETQASRYDDSESIDEQHLAAARQSMGSEGGQQYVYEDDEADLVRMRYSFEAEQPGELTVGSGEELRVLDKSSEDWYFIERTDGSNDRGVVPASFLY